MVRWAGFMGMGMASDISGGMMGAASNVNFQADTDNEWRCARWNDAGGGACDTSCWAGSTQAPQAPAGWACAVWTAEMRENSVPTVENRHRKPCGDL